MNPEPAKVPNPWWEVAAVLAVGVVPNLSSAFAPTEGSGSRVSFRYDAIHLAVLSCCTILAVLHIIRRNEAEWERFGINRIRLSDFVVGLFLFVVALWVLRLSSLFPIAESELPDDYFPRPGNNVDWAILVFRNAISAFSEELVTRVYLVTRLSSLLGSTVLSIVLAAALFASYHIYQGVPGTVYSFLFGIAYGAAYVLHRRIWPLAIGHAAYNTAIELLQEL